MRKVTAVSFLAALALAAPAPAFQATSMQPDTGGALAYDANRTRLRGSVSAGADLGAVIARIGALAGIELRMQAGLGPVRRNVSLDGLTVEAALERLLGGRSYVIWYADAGVAERRIDTIWILVDGAAFTPPERRPVAADPSPRFDPVAEANARAVAVRDIVALSNARDGAALARLRELALTAPDPHIRRAAYSALAGVAATENFNLFRFYGLRDRDPSVRIEAARSLMRADPDHSPALLREAARREADPVARDILARLAAGETVERDRGLTHAPVLR